ncbi:MAG: LysR family transcriptional regulator [Rhodobacteraceae bacterium]|nr:LysR family transcriptional regulator [Paracoccaceae bacterium]
MARNLDLAALRSLLAVADTGGVTRAAQRLHLTQSAVSMQLKRLEETMAVALLNREGRGVSLTKKGEELVSQARKLLSLNDDIWERMTTPEHTGEVVLGLPHDVIYPLAPSILKAFNRDYPGVKVVLVSSLSTVLLDRLESGKADVVLTTEAGLSPHGEILAKRPLVWVGAPSGRAWRRQPVPIAFESRCAFRKITLDALEQAGFDWNWSVDTACFDAAMASIAADLAVCTMLRGTIPRQLVEIDHGGDLPEMPELNINMYVTKGPGAEMAARLAEYVRADFAPPETVYAEAGGHVGLKLV